MVEVGLVTTGGQQMETVEEELRVEMESCRARVTLRFQRAKAEQMAQATEAEAGIWKNVVELEGRRSQTVPKG